MSMSDSERLLSPQEVADFLGVPLPTIYKWRYSGAGPQGFKIGRHVRYRRSAIEDWLERQADPQPA